MHKTPIHHSLNLKFSKKYPKIEKDDPIGTHIFFNGAGWAKHTVEFYDNRLLGLYIKVIDMEICANDPVTYIGMTKKSYNRYCNILEVDSFTSFIGIPIRVCDKSPFPIEDPRGEHIWTNLTRWS